METAWPLPRPRKRGILPVSAAALACLGLLWCGWNAPGAALTVVSSPSHLRQVDVLTQGSKTAFYLHNAGYRLLHKRQLIAVVYGGGDWQVTWAGPDAVKIGFGRDWARIVRGRPLGLDVAITEP